MKSLLYSLFFVAAGAALAQAPSAAVVHTSNDLGFSFTVPADWTVVDTSAEAREKARQRAGSEDARKGLGCVEMGATARHGSPPSVLTEVALPFDCYGQQMTSSDLPGFADDASTALQQNFDLREPVFGSYSLGTHAFWIERVDGTMKGKESLQYTVEIACSITKKAAACWMIMAADKDALAQFEHTAVTLDGEGPAPLVPASAFEKKPQ
ncbi:MAG TPA: hypothetical protein VG225_10925 [Terracidiphilus sp.]|jgi:hypothetical protein|nr:hypothetical protein [Terracidiphilus sp.]